jgi:hypothetical protein
MMEVLSLQNVLACPLMQLGDGDGERGGADGGDEEGGEETRSPNLSMKRSYLIAIKIRKCM